MAAPITTPRKRFSGCSGCNVGTIPSATSQGGKVHALVERLDLEVNSLDSDIGAPATIRLLKNYQPYLYQLSTAFSFFVLLVIAAVYPISVGLLRLIFIGADGLSGHVAWIVMELSRFLFARLPLVRILVVVVHGMLLECCCSCLVRTHDFRSAHDLRSWMIYRDRDRDRIAGLSNVRNDRLFHTRWKYPAQVSRISCLRSRHRGARTRGESRGPTA